MVDRTGHGRSLASASDAPASIRLSMDSISQAIVLADGSVGQRDEIDAAWPGWRAAAPFVVAADGGARHAAPLGLRIDLWVGDGDSLGDAGIAALEVQGIPVERAPVDKDESDTELALRAALDRRPEAIAILGALGGARLDHALANLAMLALPELHGIDVRLLATDARVRLIDAGSVALHGRLDDLVTLLPVGADAAGVTTSGLAYPLTEETLYLGRSRGLSNRRTAASAIVTLRAGRLLVVETPARLSR
jgi:thiamine pyrophosphokinase